MLTTPAHTGKILCSLVLIFLIITPAIHHSLAQGAGIDELLSKYGSPLVVPLRKNLSNIQATFIDPSRGTALLVGSIGGVTVATLFNTKYFELEGATYPILGELTSYDVDDTYSPTHYAFGSSRGEVLVLGSEDLAFKFRYIQGDEFGVSKVFITKDIAAAMFVGSRTFVKVFNLSTGGWVEYGEVVGNAPRESTENIKIVDLSMLKFLYGDKVGTKDMIMLAYYTIPVYKVLVQVINASTNEPLANTVVYVRNDVLGTIYEGVTDREGYALVPVDLTKKRENLTVFVKLETTCYEYTFTNVELEPIDTNVYSLGKTISVPGGNPVQPPQVVRRLILDIIDFSDGKPRRIKTLNRDDVISLKVHAFLDVTVLDQKYKYLLVLSGRFANDPSYPSLRIMHLDSSFNLLSETEYRLFSDISAVTYTPDGKYIVVGTAGGTIYVLKSSATGVKYEVLWGYRMPAKVTSLAMASKVSKAVAILAGDAVGDIQLLYLPTSDELVPILRLNKSLSYNVNSPVTSLSTTLDLNTVVIGTAKTTYLVSDLGSYLLETGEPIDLRSRELQQLLIRAVTVNQTPISGAAVRIYESRGRLIAEGSTDINGTYRVDYILPATYNLTIEPPVDYLQRYSSLIQVSKEVQEVNVVCNYTTIPVYVSLLDSETRGPIEEEVTLTITGPETFIKYNVLSENSSFYVRLLPGHYTVSVSPSRYIVGKPLYQGAEASLDVPKDKNVTIYLTRNTFRLTLRFIDSITRGPPRESVEATLYRNGRVVARTEISTYRNILPLTLRDKGVFIVKVNPLPPENQEPYYVGATYVVNVTSDTQEVILLKPNYISLVLNITDERTGEPPLTSIKVLLDGEHVETLQANETKVALKVIKGIHSIALVPQPEYSYLKIPLYNATELRVEVLRATSLNISLKRIYFKVQFNIKDHYTGKGPIEKIVLLVNNVKVAEILPNATAPVTFSTFLHSGKNTIQFKGMNVYVDYIKKIDIKNETTINVELLRKLYTLKLIVVNDIGQKITGGTVEVLGTNLKFETASSIVDGEAYLKLPFGMYIIKVTQPGYEAVSTERVVDHDIEISVVLYPTIMTLLTRYLPVIVGVSVIAAIIALVFKYRAKIKSLIAPEEELF